MATKTKPAPTPDAATEAAPAEGKRKRKLLVIIAAAVGAGVLLGAAWFFLLRPSGDPDAEAAPAPPEEGEVVEVGELTVNLSGSATNYARVGFAVVLSADASPDTVTPDFPLLKDAAISEIGRFSTATLGTPEGVDELRSALSGRATSLYPGGQVLRVVLTSLIVQ